MSYDTLRCLDTRVILYYGCESTERIGHYLFGPSMEPVNTWHPKRWEDVIPWGFKLDGGLCPPGAQVEGIIAYSHHEHWHDQTNHHWSAISWWDRSADKRPASSATFLVNTHCSATELLMRARVVYPAVFARMKYKLMVPDEHHVWRYETVPEAHPVISES